MLSRKIFSANCTLPPGVATSLATLMKNSLLHWGYETTALTTPNADSFIGSEAGIVPTDNLNVGGDSNVRDANADPLYKGVLVQGGTNFSLQDFGYGGIIDPNAIFLYRAAGTTVDIVFQGR